MRIVEFVTGEGMSIWPTCYKGVSNCRDEVQYDRKLEDAICDLQFLNIFTVKTLPNMSKRIAVVPDEVVISKIYLIRGQKVMIDRDLAELYDLQQSG